ncbi:NmrA/HSCARG family protein [Sphingomonas carotinifaciens]|uniref:NAD(P)H-binding protein n=1 Tax=Sphingomonas carotinifaciens TaxID=1166323 RepID=A0A1G7M0B1_9SPHN|nr:NmrA/HSCARG family protein [Sphingomonas carotinifaciens]MBB4086968.1 uncharacterized protein YbjT (DUF2867 family) [Sphingomonas carotinifaciens]MWC42162.1 NAD(P)H-binding protein [Sphingomonas carotinifaciens]SDF55187.1 Uncharacterized conserved protein YbjT, contains NAD(P)-binding and DUF2867 domains [Sphingomonas carotinifaciens]
MSSDAKKVIAVFGATGQQGGGVVRALTARGDFIVRALTRNPGKYDGPADEVAEADLDRPETLAEALTDAYGVFLVTNYWQEGVDELQQATAAIDAAKAAGVEHFVWSTLPNAEAISDGKYKLPQFSGKAKIDPIVGKAGFKHHSFVVPPAYYQNFSGQFGPQPQQDGSLGWTLPLDPTVRCFHLGDIGELGDIVAGAFAHPEKAGDGAYLPLVGDFLSFNDMLETLRQQGHEFSFNQVPRDVFAGFFPGADALVENMAYYEDCTYLGPDPQEDAIALANAVAGRTPTCFADWARDNFRIAPPKQH